MMFSNDDLRIFILFMLIVSGTAREINLPPRASWSERGISVAGKANGKPESSPLHLNKPFDISITSNDVLYISDTGNHRILAVSLGSNKRPVVIGTRKGPGPKELNSPYGLCIRNTSLYVIDYDNHRVQKLSLNNASSKATTHLTGLNKPYYLFVDSNDNTYLSDTFNHRVLLIQSGSTVNRTVAGNGESGSNNKQLNCPYGIFITRSRILYIADHHNHRIMQWFLGSESGTPVAGNGTAGSSSAQLSHPTQILVDTNEYIYISEAGNSRITRWASGSTYGVCIAACTGTVGIALTQLNSPHSLAFDNKGSLYVSDWNQNRVQKFEILRDTVSYNQPDVCAKATWDTDGTTFANQSSIGSKPHGIFINVNDDVYVADHTNNHILVWSNGTTSPTNILSLRLYEYTSLFVTTNGNVYFENGNRAGRIDKWKMNSTNSAPFMKFSDHCDGLFLDIHNYVYCSIRSKHKVMKLPLDRSINKPIAVAGTGKRGSGPLQLNEPWGLCVDTNMDLYVADSVNNRVQFFRQGQRNGVTVAGKGIPNNLTLKLPTDVVLDANGYLYIVDSGNHRIIRAGHGEFKCLAGCSKKSGSKPYELNKPYAIRFDTLNSLYVVDEANHRIQKFGISTNSCETTTAIGTTIETSIKPAATNATTIEPTTLTSTIIKPASATDTTSLSWAPISYTTIEPPTTTVTTTPLVPATETTIQPATAPTSMITIQSSTIISLSSQKPAQLASSSFFPTCPNTKNIGSICNVSGTVCDMLEPCQNNGTCNNTNDHPGYQCSYVTGFEGSRCELDHRSCKDNTCWNGGTCHATADSILNCTCVLGWEGDHCERKTDYCFNITCKNGGLCRPLFLNYSCECLGESYSGRRCEIVSKKLIAHQIVSKSFAYIALLAMSIVAIFVITMDILKYCFSIDPPREELERYRREKSRRKRTPVIKRFVYVNAPPSSRQMI